MPDRTFPATPPDPIDARSDAFLSELLSEGIGAPDERVRLLAIIARELKHIRVSLAERNVLLSVSNAIQERSTDAILANDNRATAAFIETCETAKEEIASLPPLAPKVPG